MHHKEEYKVDFAISKHYHGSYHMGKGEDSQWSSRDAKGLSNQCSNNDPKQSPYPRTICWYLLNPKRQCWWRRTWRHGRINRLFHICYGGHCITLFSSTYMGTWSSWLYICKGWTDVWYARIPHATLLNSIHLHTRPDHYTFVSNLWHDEGPVMARGFRFGIHTILVFLAISVKKGE